MLIISFDIDIIHLSFVNPFRKTVQLGPNANWTPFLNKIIDNTQECCKRLYQGELRVE